MANRAFKFYEHPGTDVWKMPSIEPGKVLHDTMEAFYDETYARVLDALRRLDESPSPLFRDKSKTPTDAWQVYGSQTLPRVKVSHVGDLVTGPTANDKLEVTKRMEPDTCDDTNYFTVEADDIIYIDVTVSSLTATAAEVKKINATPGWTDYPSLATFSGNDQTRLYIPLAYVEDVSAANWESVTREGDFTLLPGCLGLYQLYPNSHITLELSTYLAKAALLPNPFPGAI